MKFKSTLLQFLLGGPIALIVASSAHAVTYYWDQNGNAAGFGVASGTWTVPTVSRWSTGANSSVGSATPGASITTLNTNATTDDVNFGNGDLGITAGTVTVTGTVASGNMTFATAAGAVLLSGGQIDFSPTATITVNNASNRITSIIGGAATSLTKAGTGSISLEGASTYAGSTIISSGTLNLGGGSATGSLASPTLTLSGGKFNYTRTGSNTQNFTTTNINRWSANAISGSASNTVNLGTVNRGTGSTYDFATTGLSVIASSDVSNDFTGIMAGFTYGDSWAVSNDTGFNISGLSTYSQSSALLDAGASYTDLNVDLDSNQTPDDVITPNSLRFSSAAANTLTLQGINSITTGGILVSSTVGTNPSAITGGTLTGATSKDLLVVQNNSAAGLAISSVIANNGGATALTKSGAGLLTLESANTFTGGVFIHGGKVVLANAAALNSTAGSQNAVSFGAGSTGALTLNGNSVVIRSLDSLPSTAVVENASGTNATLTVGNSANASGSFAGIIQNGTGTGTLALTKSGSGTLTLAGANTYTGGTTLSAGTLVANNGSAFGTGKVTVSGSSTLNFGPGLTFTNDIAVNAAVTMKDIMNTQNILTFSGVLSGSSNITISNNGNNGVVGEFAFTNTANTWTGNVVLVSGSSPGDDRFSFNSIGDGGNFTFQKSGHQNSIIYTGSSNLAFTTRTINVGAIGGIYDGGGTIPVNAFTNNGTGTVTFNANMTVGAVGAGGGTLFFNGTNAGNNTYAGTIGAGTGGAFGIGKTGTGKWILTGSNSYTGEVLIRNGTLSVNAINTITNNQPLGKNAVVQLGHNGDSGILEFTGAASSTDKTFRLGSTQAAGLGTGTILNNGSGALTYSATTFNPTITGITATRLLTLGGSYTGGTNEIQGIIQDNVASTGKVGVTKTGAGTWKLSGANTYTGNTIINAGTLDLGNVKSLGNSGTLDFDAASTTRLSTDTAFGGSNPVYNVRIDAPGSYASTIELNRATAGAVTGITHNFGAMTITLNGGGAATVNVTAGANAPTGGALDTIAFTSLSAGNNNAVTETFNPTGGNITFGTVQSSTGNASITTIALSGTTAGNAITGVIGGINANQNSVAITKTNSSTWTLSGANTYTGGTTITGGILSVNTIADTGTSALALSGTLTLNGGTLSYTGAGAASTTRAVTMTANSTIDLPSGSLSLGAGIAGGALTLAKSSPGTLILTGATDNTSLFLNVTGGVVQLDKASSASVRAVAGISGVSSGATVQLLGTGSDQIYDGPFFVSTNGVNGLNGTLDVNGKSESTSNFNGGSTGALDNTSGTPSTFTIGNQDVSSTFAGTIKNTGANLSITKIGSGTLTLSGLNTYSGNTAVNGGILALSDNAQLKFVIGATSGTSNVVTGTGTFTIDGDFNIDTTITDATALTSGTWVLVNAATLSETFASTFTIVGAGWSESANVWTKTVGSKKYTFTEADGTLVLSPAASYASWIDSFFPAETDIAIIGPDADPDKDGVANAVEMVVGGNPATGMDLALLPTIELVTDPVSSPVIPDGEYLLFTYRRSDLSVAAGVTADCETDTDLIAPWTAATGAPGVVIQVDDNFTFTPPAADTDRVRVYVPRDANTKIFGRLKVQVP